MPTLWEESQQAEVDLWIDPETAMLMAVRNELLMQLDLDKRKCDIEYDELAPHSVADLYIPIVPAGFTPGPSHEEGQAEHYIFSTTVTIMMKVADVPQDRLRNVMTGESKWVKTSVVLNNMFFRIIDRIDGNYDVMNAANTILSDSGDTREGFHTPLNIVGADIRPRAIPTEIFGGTGAQTEMRGRTTVGLGRSVTFGGMERLTTRLRVLLAP